MATFSVDPSELDHLAGTARQLASDLDPEQVRRSNLSGVGGTTAVEWATNDFVGAWGSGLEKVRDNLRVLSERLEQAAGAYGTTEGSVRDAAAQMAAGLTPAGRESDGGR